MKVSFKTLFYLAFQGKWARRVITIILSAFAFSLFALGMTSYTYNYENNIVKGYLNYNQNRTFNIIDGVHTVDDIKQIEEMIGTQCLYFPQETLQNSETFLYWNNFLGTADRNDRMRTIVQIYGLEEEVSNDFSHGSPYDSIYLKTLGGAMYNYGTEQMYHSMGYELLAGKFPTEEFEVAISEAHFEAFYRLGYRDVSECFRWNGSRYEINEDTAQANKIEIKDYTDILGKTLGAGNIGTDEHAYEYKIVGVVNTNFNTDYEGEEINNYPAGRFLLAGFDRETAGLQANTKVYCPAISDKAVMKKFVQQILSWKAAYEAGEINDYPILNDMDKMFHTETFNNEKIFLVIGLAGGGLFGIFAVVLNSYLTSQSIQSKQKKIGILRSMGADRKTVSKIFILESLIMATTIFLLALCASLAAFYGWLQPWALINQFGVSVLVYNGWTALILAAVCYAVPLLSTLFPLKKFFKQTIVDNLSGNYKKKSK